MESAHNVVIYSTPTCRYCRDAKSFLEQRGVAFKEYDVSVDVERREEMVRKSSARIVPTIVVGERVFVGLDKFLETLDKEPGLI